MKFSDSELSLLVEHDSKMAWMRFLCLCTAAMLSTAMGNTAATIRTRSIFARMDMCIEPCLKGLLHIRGGGRPARGAHDQAGSPTMSASSQAKPVSIASLRAGKSKSGTAARKEKAVMEETCITPEKEAWGFYALLQVERGATAGEIKKSYRRLAIACHPDRNRDDPGATEKFQALQRVYEVLSDEDQRQVYDSCGGMVIGDDADWAEFGGMGFAELRTYFKGMYRKVDAAEIARYEKEYQGGPEEAKDLAEYYKKFSGNLSHVTAHIPYAEEEDVPRFVGLISKMVHSKELPMFPAFKKLRLSKADAQAASAAPLPKRPDGDMAGLLSAMAANRDRRDKAGGGLLRKLAKLTDDDLLLAPGGGRGKRKGAVSKGSSAEDDETVLADGGGRKAKNTLAKSANSESAAAGNEHVRGKGGKEGLKRSKGVTGSELKITKSGVNAGKVASEAVSKGEAAKLRTALGATMLVGGESVQGEAAPPQEPKGVGGAASAPKRRKVAEAAAKGLPMKAGAGTK